MANPTQTPPSYDPNPYGAGTREDAARKGETIRIPAPTPPPRWPSSTPVTPKQAG